MAEAKPFIYKNSFGFRITINVQEGKLDTTTNLLLRIKGTGPVVEKNLTIENIIDVAKGTVVYDVVEDDFPTAGEYTLQLFDNTPGRFIPSDPKKLMVKDTI
jgi:hypothetical protein